MRRLFAISLLAFAATVVALASPQADNPVSVPGPLQGLPANGRRDARPCIDGARNPELINVEILVSQVFRSLSMSATPTPMEESRFRNISETIGLGGKDLKTLRREMIRLNGLVSPIMARLQTNQTPTPIVDLETIRKESMQTYGRLLELLSDGGNRRLRDWIEKQKRNSKAC